jgi:hypothetical protein
MLDKTNAEPPREPVALCTMVFGALKAAGAGQHLGLVELNELCDAITARLAADPRLMGRPMPLNERPRTDAGFPAVCRLEALVFATEHAFDCINNLPHAKEHLAVLLGLLRREITELRQSLWGEAMEP